MSDRVKTYFLVPHWDIPPDALQLGNVLDDPTQPHLSLYGSQPPSRPDSTPFSTNEGFVIDTPIRTVNKPGFSITTNRHGSNKLGIFAQFLQVVGIRAQAGLQRESSDIETFVFDSHVEEWFEPSMNFIEKVLAQPAVQTFRTGKSKAPLYIVTGVRTVEGITAGTDATKEKTISGELSVDATGSGVPLNIGPTIEHTRGKEQEIKWTSPGPLVYAYRLCRIRPNKKPKAFNKGAFYGVDPKQQDVDIGLDIDFLKAITGNEEDAEDVDDEVDVQEAVDDVDGTDCIVVVPT